MSKQLEDFINKNRGAFDTRMPDPAVLQRIQQQVAGDGQKKQKGILVPMRMVRLAAACCVLLAGIALYQVSEKTATKEITARVNKTVPENIPQAIPLTQPAATAAIENDKINGSHPVTRNESVARDIAARKQVLFASLNNMESPSQRLEAAMRAAETSHAGKDIVDALVHTMNTDPSSNVRLAALDGLGKFYREPYVRKQLIASLKKQKDPLVQIGLIDLLTKMKEASIVNELDRIVKDGNTMEAVKDHAYSGIFTLRS
jgi:hypothetical protein